MSIVTHFKKKLYKLMEKNVPIDDLIKDKDIRIALLEKELQERKQIIQSQQEEFKLLLKQKTLEETNTRKNLKKNIEQLDNEKLSLENKLQQEKNQVNILTHQLDAQAKHIGILQQHGSIHLADSEERIEIINQIRSSLSYRLGFGLTAPVRWVHSILNKKDSTTTESNLFLEQKRTTHL